MTYSVCVNFGSCECQDYDREGFNKLSEAKNYCEGLIGEKKVKWTKSEDYISGELGLVLFMIWKIRKKNN